MADPISVTRDGHRTFLKWHRARRRGTDPVFTGRRILEGMALGASVEVDLVLHADDGFAVLHDLVARRARRPAAARSARRPAADAADAPPARQRRRPDRRPGHAARGPRRPDRPRRRPPRGAAPARLQGGRRRADPARRRHLRRARSARRRATSSSRPATPRRSGCLAAGVPGLRIGYDPCHMGAIERLMASRDYPAFVADALGRLAGRRAHLPRPRARALRRRRRLRPRRRLPRRRPPRRRLHHPARRRRRPRRRPPPARARVDQITTDDPEGLGAALG